MNVVQASRKPIHLTPAAGVRNVERRSGESMWYICLRSRRQNAVATGHGVTLDEHLAWMRAQHEAGIVLFSGPSPKRKLGIYIVRARSEEEARAVVHTDPYVANGECEFDLLEWDVRQALGAGPFTTQDIEAQTSRPAPHV